MYYPYFRGKQYELITVREMAPLMQRVGFRPIIEPVRETLSGLQKTLKTLVDARGGAIVVVNPHHGDLSGAGESVSDLLKNVPFGLPGVSAGVLLKEATTTAEALDCYGAHVAHSPAFIHAGFTDAKALAENLGKSTKDQSHVFFERLCGKLYRRHFNDAHRVLLRDGFEKKRNREYGLIEPFSDLHATFRDEGMDGFGDFLIVGDDYIESGGPAYAVAIHLTFIDPDQDETMKIYHFVSDRQDTPLDPAGKFAEALTKMIATVDSPKSNVLETEAVGEFRELHRKRHFPGLGYVKKLSMNHHIETLADYFAKAM